MSRRASSSGVTRATYDAAASLHPVVDGCHAGMAADYFRVLLHSETNKSPNPTSFGEADYFKLNGVGALPAIGFEV